MSCRTHVPSHSRETYRNFFLVTLASPHTSIPNRVWKINSQCKGQSKCPFSLLFLYGKHSLFYTHLYFGVGFVVPISLCPEKPPLYRQSSMQWLVYLDVEFAQLVHNRWINSGKGGPRESVVTDIVALSVEKHVRKMRTSRIFCKKKRKIQNTYCLSTSLLEFQNRKNHKNVNRLWKYMAISSPKPIWHFLSTVISGTLWQPRSGHWNILCYATVRKRCKIKFTKIRWIDLAHTYPLSMGQINSW